MLQQDMSDTELLEVRIAEMNTERTLQISKLSKQVQESCRKSTELREQYKQVVPELKTIKFLVQEMETNISKKINADCTSKIKKLETDLLKKINARMNKDEARIYMKNEIDMVTKGLRDDVKAMQHDLVVAQGLLKTLRLKINQENDYKNAEKKKESK